MRQLIERLESQRDQMVSSLWSNSAYDEAEKGSDARNSVIGQLDQSLEDARALVYGYQTGDPADEEPGYSESNPFFAKAKEGLDRVAPPRGDDLDADVTAAMVVKDESDTYDMWKDIDQG